MSTNSYIDVLHTSNIEIVGFPNKPLYTNNSYVTPIQIENGQILLQTSSGPIGGNIIGTDGINVALTENTYIFSLSGNIDTSNINFLGNLNIAGNITLLEDLNVSGNSTLSKDLTVDGNVIADNISSNNAFVNFGGSYYVGTDDEASLDRFRFHSVSTGSYIDSGREIMIRLGTPPNDAMTINNLVVMDRPLNIGGFRTFNYAGIPLDYLGEVVISPADVRPFFPFGIPSLQLSMDIEKDMLCYGGFWTLSDSRIKKNISAIVDSSTLDILRKVEPKTYNYIDSYNKVYGFIAQQIREVLPEAVGLTIDYIPNFYRVCSINNNIITLNDHQLQDYDLIKIFDSTNNAREFIIKVIDSNTIKIQLNNIEIQNCLTDLNNRIQYIDSQISQKKLASLPDEILDLTRQRKLTNDIITNIDKYNSLEKINTYNSQIFIYGKKVTDFHNLDKNYIFTVNVAATQELDRRVTDLEQQMESMSDEISNLKQQIEGKQNIIDNLQNRINILKQKIN